MNIGTIPDPFAGEKVADVFPKIASFVEPPPVPSLAPFDRTDGRRFIFPKGPGYTEQISRLARLNYFPGRHLTAVNLKSEQNVRVQRMLLRGRAVTAGVASGLEVSWLDGTGGIQFRIQPGQGLTRFGVDIVVDHSVGVLLKDLYFFDPSINQVSADRFGTLALSLTTGFAGVLVLQPGYAEDADLPLALQSDGNGTDFLPGPRSPDDEVYYKTTTTDAARVVLYPLPSDETWDAAPGPHWQNRAAWSVFNHEAAGGEIPWHALGVPLALVGFNDDLVPEWVDRHAVVRPAGRPPRRALAYPGFDTRVWFARFDQFCSQLSGLSAPASAKDLCRYLPPIGLIPKTYLDLTRQAASGGNPPTWLPKQDFFPDAYLVDVGVVPLEQLDALIADTACLEPYDIEQLDSVRLLLPVSQRWFDPALLNIEVIDPQFQQHIDLYRETRDGWLAQRYDLANRRYQLEDSVNHQTTPYPLNTTADDPKRLEDESPDPALHPPPDPAVQYGVTRGGTPAAPTYNSQLLAELRATGAGFAKKFVQEDIAEFTALFTACGLPDANDKAILSKALRVSVGDSFLTWIANLGDGNDQSLNADEKSELRRELLAYIQKQATIQQAEQDKLSSGTLQEIIDYFDTKADETDELVDAGFLKARTDVFRLGTLLNNSGIVTKFTASPSLASIIDRKPPKADTASVNAFASRLLADIAPTASSSSAATALNTGSSASAATGTAANAVTTLASSFANTIHTKTEALTKTDPAKTQASLKKLSSLNNDQLKALNLTPDDVQNIQALPAMATQLSSTLSDSVSNLQQLASLGNTLPTASAPVVNFIQESTILSQNKIRSLPLERLQPPPVSGVRQDIHDGRLEIFERLTRLNISLGDLTTDFVDVPGTVVRPPPPPSGQILKITRLRFQTLISRRKFDVLSTVVGAEISDADESRNFSSSVSYADMAMAALRAVEARIKEYRAFVDQCRATLKQTQDFITQITTALATVEVELEESRQDVAVALTLKKEEQARLDGINAHREKIIQEHVEFLVFHRPRAIKLNSDVAIRRLEPSLTSEPVIDCLIENPTPPADLAALRDIFSASPARWFKYAPTWIEKVDQWEHLRGLLDRASRTTLASISQVPAITTGRYTQVLTKLYQTRQDSVQKYAVLAQDIVPAALVSLSWRDLQQQAQTQLTLGHLIAAGPAPLARAAAEELDHLFVVTTCLHENFCSVPGLVRLDWAEKFGQFDNVSIDFRDLSRLPSWPQIDFVLRREMQIHVDWIFGRIDQTQPDALDLINDLIRVALLLASHAPVDQLIVGQPIDPEVKPLPGDLIRLRVDPLRIRRGMDVVYTATAPDTRVLRAVVEDISSSHVAARVIESPLTNGVPVKLTSGSNLFFKTSVH